MDRRTFARHLTLAGLGLVGCSTQRDAEEPPTTPSPPVDQPEYATAEARAFGVVANLAHSAEPVAGGVRWGMLEAGRRIYPTHLYEGQAGILTFLAEAYRVRPDAELATLLERGGSWLEAQPRLESESLYEGNAGHAWAFLALHRTIGRGTTRWLDAALRIAPAVASSRGGWPCDLINGPAGHALFLLELHRVTGDARWLAAARDTGTYMLGRAVREHGGIKFPSYDLTPGAPGFYLGFAHGTAGTGYVLCRIAQALPEGSRAPFLDGARLAAEWLYALALPDGDAVNWHRRQPDQMDVQQVQWCHGAPGIGVFFAELYKTTRDARYLRTAEQCAATVDALGARGSMTCLCHGVGGNAGLYLKLFRETGDATWLSKAEALSDVVWARRFRASRYPAWPSGDGNGVDNPGLLTGTSGVGWFYLQLAEKGRLGSPVAE